MDQDIQNMVKSCKGCALVTESPPVNYQPWPNTDKCWSWLHVDYARPSNGVYYLIVIKLLTKRNKSHVVCLNEKPAR